MSGLDAGGFSYRDHRARVPNLSSVPGSRAQNCVFFRRSRPPRPDTVSLTLSSALVVAADAPFPPALALTIPASTRPLHVDALAQWRLKALSPWPPPATLGRPCWPITSHSYASMPQTPHNATPAQTLRFCSCSQHMRACAHACALPLATPGHPRPPTATHALPLATAHHPQPTPRHPTAQYFHDCKSPGR